jgi:putative glutamine amidotransferase
VKVTIGITDTLKPNLQLYMDWIHRGLPDAECLPLSPTQRNADEVDRCDGLLLTGGGDIHPKYYRREDALALVHDVNEQRDAFEFDVVRKAIKENVPTLGICRGMQLFNVALGGTLIPDVQAAGFRDHSRERESRMDRRHGVTLVAGSMLHALTGAGTGEINSSHHQAVEKAGEGLRIVAHSDDGVIEGAEWSDPNGKAFLQLVQWHPEQMDDDDNPFTGRLRAAFFEGVRVASRHKKMSH